MLLSPRGGGTKEGNVSPVNNLLSCASIPDSTNNSAEVKAVGEVKAIAEVKAMAEGSKGSRGDEVAMESESAEEEKKKENGSDVKKGEKDKREESVDEATPSKRIMPTK